MSSDRSTRSATGRSAIAIVARVFADLLIIGLWVLFLSLVFLSTGWPWWAFYAALLLGVGGYVQFTAGWR